MTLGCCKKCPENGAGRVWGQGRNLVSSTPAFSTIMPGFSSAHPKTIVSEITSDPNSQGRVPESVRAQEASHYSALAFANILRNIGKALLIYTL